MNNKKKIVIVAILLLVVVFISWICVVNFSNSGVTLEWVKVEDTSVEQYKICLKNKYDKYVSGKVTITTIANDTFEEKITKKCSENIYIKSVIKDVKIQN